MTTNFTINRKELCDALTAALAVVPNKPQRDILKCIKIKAIQSTPDSILIYATDLETYVIYKVDKDVIVSKEGEFVVPAITFFEYIKSLEGDSVDVHQTSEEGLKINESGTEMEVGLQDLAEFPDFPEIPKSKNDWVSLPDIAIKRALSLVIFAVADKGHPKWGALAAVCMNFEKDKISFIGTDQHRASVANLEIIGQNLTGSYLISASAMETVGKIFNSDFQLLPNAPNSLIFRSDHCTLFVRLITGDFPPVRRIVDLHKHQQTLELIVPDFLRQVKKAALAVDQHNTIKIEIKDAKLQLIAKTKEQRKNIKVDYAINYKGNGIQFAINCTYLLDLLKASSTDEPLIMRFNRSNQSLLFEQQNFEHLVMPQETR